MANYFELAREMKNEIKKWLKTHGIREWDDRFLSDEELDTDDEPEVFYMLEQDLLHALGYKGNLERCDVAQLSNLVTKFCSGEQEAGHCDIGCDGCSVNNVVMEIQRSFQMNPDYILDDDKPEFFGRLIDTVEDWLAACGFASEDFPNEDRDDATEEGLAIIYGKDYDVLADAFAEVIGITR